MYDEFLFSMDDCSPRSYVETIGLDVGTWNGFRKM